MDELHRITRVCNRSSELIYIPHFPDQPRVCARLIEIFSVNSVDEGNPAATSAKDLSLHDISLGNHHFELVGDVPIVPLSGDAEVVGTCRHVNGKWRRKARFQLNYLRRRVGG